MLKYNCVFCNKKTNFKDNKVAYCVDCYVKIRDSAHTHLIVKPSPISPLPTTPPSSPVPTTGPYVVTC